MNWGVLNGVMLFGLLGAGVPVLIHLWNRRRDEVVDWGAMQFLELGRRARRRVRLTEVLLLLARTVVLAAVAVALARPFWSRSGSQPAGATAAAGLGAGFSPRDVVLVLDGSASMGRALGGASPHERAVRWARRFVRGLRPGDSVAILVAGDRVRPLIDPPTFDQERVDAALAGVKSSRGASDLPAALGEAFRLLERTGNPGREVIVLTDGQRFAWRPGEPGRWALLRDLHRRLPVPPRVWSVAFGAGEAPDGPDGAVGALSVSRTLLTPGLPVRVSAVVNNAGPGPLSCSAELLVDGEPAPVPARAVGPVPAGGSTPVAFQTALPTPGAHLLTVRLVGGPEAPDVDDESSLPVAVKDALPVLLVDGEPGLEPLGGDTDFLRAALAPAGDDSPEVRVTSISFDTFTREFLSNQSVVVFANVERPAPGQAAAVSQFVDAGGGLLIAPGDRTDPEFWNGLALSPARLGEMKGDAGARAVVAHPAPRSFEGPAPAPFGEGESPPLGEADLFTYRVLAPVPGASVAARLDTGDPWVVERGQGKGRVMLLCSPLDAEGGTLPVNPDFVPLAHEWVFHLAGGHGSPRAVPAGEPLLFDTNISFNDEVKVLAVRLPDGAEVMAPVQRTAGAARVRVDDTSRSGVYRLALPDPPGGFLYAAVAADARERDFSPLEPAEAAKLSAGWPLVFETDPDRLAARLFAPDRGGKHEVWRFLVLAALGGLCAEIWLTRRLVRGQGLAAD